MSKISLSSIPASLIDCLDPVIKPLWDYLSRDEQIHELEKARETLEWRQGPGKSWGSFVENVFRTQQAVLNYYSRQLFGRCLSLDEIVEYLCAEYGMTHTQALAHTIPELSQILRVVCREKGITDLRSRAPDSPELFDQAGFGRAAPGLLHFDLPSIFRCSVELGAAVSNEIDVHPDGECSPAEEWRLLTSGDEAARQRLRARVEASERCETAMMRLKSVLNPSKAEFFKGWEEAVNLADTSLVARQALMTLGLALADLRGDTRWLERGRELLSAGTWNLWEGIGPNDRKAVRPLLSETHRLWGWPGDPADEPAPFAGPTATKSDHRILNSDWRTLTEESLDKAINGAFQRGWERCLSLADRQYSHLQILAPEQTPAVLAAAYEAVAGALVRAWYLQLHVLPVVGDADRGNSSDRARDRRLELPYGYFTFEQTARQVMNDREQARSAYRNAEVPLRASLDAGSRCMFAAALAWVEEIVIICESALAAQLPWDQAAAAIYSIRSVNLSQMLEEMRRQTSRAALQHQQKSGSEYATHLAESFTRSSLPEAAAEENEPTHPDEPEGGCWLWWQGKRHDLSKGNVYKLVAFMWSRESASYDTLVGPVFESDVAPQTIRSYAHKANNDLKRIGIPWRLSTDSVTRHIIKKNNE